MKRLALACLLLTGAPWLAEAALISRGTTWADQQVLTHSALNSEFDILFVEVNGLLSAANLAADSVASSELLEGDDYTMNNLILSTTAPDIRWNPTSGDSFHAGAEYSATSGSIWFLSNVTDGKHYLRIRNDHLFEFPQYLSCSALSTGADGKLICGTLPSEVGGTNATRVHRTAADVTTTSTSLVDLTGASITKTTGANPVQVNMMGSAYNSGGNTNLFNIDIDGALQMGTEGMQSADGTANIEQNISFSYQSAALTAASHTVKIQWAVSAGTGTLTADTVNANNFSLFEVLD